MSAVNWAICPRCLGRARDSYAADYEAVMSAYETIPVDEFDQRRTALKLVEPEDYRTFREDYEFHGAADGEINAVYSGGCTTCELNVELQATKRFYPCEGRGFLTVPA